MNTQKKSQDDLVKEGIGKLHNVDKDNDNWNVTGVRRDQDFHGDD